MRSRGRYGVPGVPACQKLVCSHGFPLMRNPQTLAVSIIRLLHAHAIIFPPVLSINRLKSTDRAALRLLPVDFFRHGRQNKVIPCKFHHACPS